eukprot:COSAG06_NODE_227_length_19736_cov_15.570708_7_plen_105_part_00
MFFLLGHLPPLVHFSELPAVITHQRNNCLRENVLFSSLLCVCPEPVLANVGLFYYKTAKTKKGCRFVLFLTSFPRPSSLSRPPMSLPKLSSVNETATRKRIIYF